MYTKGILSEDLKIMFVILVEIECVKTVNSGERLRITSSIVVSKRLQSDFFLGTIRMRQANKC